MRNPLIASQHKRYKLHTFILAYRFHSYVICWVVGAGVSVTWIEITDGQVVRAGKMYCHDLEVMSSNPSRVKLGVFSTSVQSRTWPKNIWTHYFIIVTDLMCCTEPAILQGVIVAYWVVGGPPGLPAFTHYILQKFWEVAEYCPQQCIEWLTGQVTSKPNAVM